MKHLTRFHILHSLDRPSLADAVDREGTDVDRVFDALVQVNIAAEETKGGFAPATLAAEAQRLRTLRHLRVRGVMTMAPFGAKESVLRAVFSGARGCLDVLRTAGHDDARELSMGMSDDFETAIEEGATCVRLGTILFGAREQVGRGAA